MLRGSANDYPGARNTVEQRGITSSDNESSWPIPTQWRGLRGWTLIGARFLHVPTSQPQVVGITRAKHLVGRVRWGSPAAPRHASNRLALGGSPPLGH